MTMRKIFFGLAGFFFSCFVVWVDGTCSSFSRTTIDIKETEKDVAVLNITFSNDTAWSMSISSVTEGPVNLTMLSGFFHQTNDNYTFIITLIRELDKELFYNDYNVNLQVITMELRCEQSGIPPTIFEVRMLVGPVNEYPPLFVYTPYEINLPEDTPAASTVYSFTNITDADRPPETMEYQLLSFSNSTVDASSFLALPQGSIPDIVLGTSVDYDDLSQQGKPTTYYLVFQVTDLTHTASTTLTVHVTDVDDLPPVFIPSCGHNCATQYSANTQSDYIGKLDLTPNDIKARDQDSLNYSISYTLDQTGIRKGFRIESQSGIIWKDKSLPRTDLLIVTATEGEGIRRSTAANVLVIIDGDPSLQTQASQNKNNVDSFKYVAIAIAVILVLVIAAFVALVIVLVRKAKRAENKVDIIKPSPTTSRETLSLSEKSRSGETVSTHDWVLQQQDLKPPDVFPEGKNTQLPPLKKPEKADKTTEAKIKRKKKKKKRTILRRQADDEENNENEIPHITETEERILID